MSYRQEDEPAKLAALGLRYVSEPVWERLRAQEDARAAEDLLPHGPGPLRLRVINTD